MSRTNKASISLALLDAIVFLMLAFGVANVLGRCTTTRSSSANVFISLAENISTISTITSAIGSASTRSALKGPLELPAGCGCYSTSGSTSALYTDYYFADFNGQTPLPITPPLPTAPDGTEGFTSSLFETGWFADNFVISSYAEPANSVADSPLENVYSKANVWITQDSPNGGTYARLRSGRASSLFQSSAEISTNFPLYHGSIRMLARVGGNTASSLPNGAGPGGVATMFTYLSTPDETDESDMELLTSGPSNILHATNQPHNTHIVNIPEGLNFQDWVEYRMDWTAGYVQWSANGQLLVTNTADVPTLSLRFLFSMWSNGGTWSGSMANVGEEVWMDVQWIELAWNVSGSTTSCVGVSTCPMLSQ